MCFCNSHCMAVGFVILTEPFSQSCHQILTNIPCLSAAWALPVPPAMTNTWCVNNCGLQPFFQANYCYLQVLLPSSIYSELREFLRSPQPCQLLTSAFCKTAFCSHCSPVQEQKSRVMLLWRCFDRCKKDPQPLQEWTPALIIYYLSNTGLGNEAVPAAQVAQSFSVCFFQQAGLTVWSNTEGQKYLVTVNRQKHQSTPEAMQVWWILHEHICSLLLTLCSFRREDFLVEDKMQSEKILIHLRQICTMNPNYIQLKK